MYMYIIVLFEFLLGVSVNRFVKIEFLFAYLK